MTSLTSFIFVVFGSTGQYEDYRTWAVAGGSEEEANLFAERLNDWAKEERVHADGPVCARDWNVVSPLDPSFHSDGGVRYSVLKVLQLGPNGMGHVTAPLTHRMNLRAA